MLWSETSLGTIVETFDRKEIVLRNKITSRLWYTKHNYCGNYIVLIIIIKFLVCLV